MMAKQYSILIIDDERLARVRLRKLLTNFAELFNIIGEAKNGLEAEELIIDLKPDIIFLDIEMPKLTGFELIQKLDKVPMVVFCTAFEEYSLKAFDTNCIDYLVKPIKLERLQQTVEKIRTLKDTLSSEKMLKVIDEITIQKNNQKKKTTIAVKKTDTIVLVKLDTVSYFKATDKYVTLYSDKGEELIEQSLAKLEENLPANFLRVHRSIIVNTDYIKEFQKYFNNRYIIILNDKDRSTITTSRSYKEALKNWIEI